jgi:hypothetical protein
MIKEIDDEKKYVYHYTSKNSFMEHILRTMEIRFGKLEKTNDPREYYGPSILYDSSAGSVSFNRALELVKNDLGKYKILSLCRDKKVDSNYERGFYKPRMWAQYGDSHKGCCLVFDRVKLEACLKQIYEEENIVSGNIDYITKDIELTLCLKENIANEIQRFVRDNIEYLLFKKTMDWFNEYEFRYAIYSEKEYEFIPVQSFLEGIVFGHDFDDDDKLFVRRKLISIETTTLDWKNGFPSYCNVYKNYDEFLHFQIEMQIKYFIRMVKNCNLLPERNLGQELLNINDNSFIALRNRVLEIWNEVQSERPDLEFLYDEIMKIMMK